MDQGLESRPSAIRVPPLTTGERVRLLRESQGMTRPVLAGLVGRSTDWLKKVETGSRQLNSLPLLLQIARALNVRDLAELTGETQSVPVGSWNDETHHVVPAIRQAMRDVAFPSPSNEPPLPPADLETKIRRLWILWHTSPRQRTDVGVQLPALIHQTHHAIRSHRGVDRRRAKAAGGDLYRLVQRLLAHICEPELHALAVERGRALSEDADEPISLALAAWSTSVSLCASGHYDDAVHLADTGARYVTPMVQSPGPVADHAWGVLGALQMEAAAAHALAGRDGDAHRYLDLADQTASRMTPGAWHEQSGFEPAGVRILSVIVTSCLRRHGDAISQAGRIDPASSPSVVRSSRLLLETADAQRHKTDYASAVQTLTAAADISNEAVALIPWARELADELAESTSGTTRAHASRLAGRLKAVR
ncbi:helix-turn-helix transcriptional regulator [Myceligenerans crystallogenes]|uniref:HTH cro/C1-type domain-containing protein n=1 Tax=Myceligenerans crystallogenes TaxID=316335 RepID=A0ABP4ZLG7_9MICO